MDKDATQTKLNPWLQSCITYPQCFANLDLSNSRLSFQKGMMKIKKLALKGWNTLQIWLLCKEKTMLKKQQNKPDHENYKI